MASKIEKAPLQGNGGNLMKSRFHAIIICFESYFKHPFLSQSDKIIVGYSNLFST